MTRLAVFPVENLTGSGVPDRAIWEFLTARLASAGFQVLEVAKLERFMSAHRIRYTGGIDAATAAALRKEAEIDGVIFASVDTSSESFPPRFGLVLRLVSIYAVPVVVWADDEVAAGESAPGLFELGVVKDYQVLVDRLLIRVTDSLLSYLKTGQAQRRGKSGSGLRPKAMYRNLELEPGGSYTVAVLPFFNITDRRQASDILALLFVRHLAGLAPFRVLDGGVARQHLLNARVIMEGGVSASDASTVAALMDADFVLGGRVLRYDGGDEQGTVAIVEFSTVLIERRSGRVVWSSSSYHDEANGVGFLQRQRSVTTHQLASEMARAVAELVVGRVR
jgi:TolB-like protein